MVFQITDKTVKTSLAGTESIPISDSGVVKRTLVSYIKDYINTNLLSGSWTSFTPTLGGVSMGFTSITSQVGKYKIIGDICYFQLHFAGTGATGTVANGFQINVPVTKKNDFEGTFARDCFVGTTETPVSGTSTSTLLYVNKVGGFTLGDNVTLLISGWYEIA